MALPRGPQAVVLGAAQQPWLGAGLHGYLTGLTDLYLNDNRLTALLPEIGNLTGLKVLATSTNGTVWDPRNQGWGRAWVNSLRVRL